MVPEDILMATIHARADGHLLAIYPDDESVPTGAQRPAPPADTAVTAVIDSTKNEALLKQILIEWRDAWTLHREGKDGKIVFRRHGRVRRHK
jgi:hypothetical protein